MASVKFYLDTRRSKDDGTYPLRIAINNKGRFLLSTGYSITPEKWAGNEFSNKEPNFKTKNAALRKIFSDMENIIFRLEVDGKLKETSDKSLKNLLKKMSARIHIF